MLSRVFHSNLCSIYPARRRMPSTTRRRRKRKLPSTQTLDTSNASLRISVDTGKMKELVSRLVNSSDLNKIIDIVECLDELRLRRIAKKKREKKEEEEARIALNGSPDWDSTVSPPPPLDSSPSPPTPPVPSPSTPSPKEASFSPPSPSDSLVSDESSNSTSDEEQCNHTEIFQKMIADYLHPERGSRKLHQDEIDAILGELEFNEPDNEFVNEIFNHLQAEHPGVFETCFVVEYLQWKRRPKRSMGEAVADVTAKEEDVQVCSRSG